jgi:hypothetical protein
MSARALPVSAARSLVRRRHAATGSTADREGIGPELMSQPSYRSYTMGRAQLQHAGPGIPTRQLAIAAALIVLLHAGAARSAITVEVLQSVSALPPHLAGLFSEPAGFHKLRSGGYLVFDRRGHTVYGIDAAMTAAKKIVEVGQETGRIIQPVAFAVSSDDRFVVADAPFGRERVQRFGQAGTRLGGFVMPGRAELRVQYGGLVLNGVASIAYEGESILVNQPEQGAVITEYSLEGWPQRNIGLLRATGHEDDPDLHRALNTGIPLFDPRGSYYFVFQTGEPRFRKYDARGTLIFERVIQGVELDAWMTAQPTEWPARRGRELPIVPPLVRTAAVDRAGNLWIALTLPFTYVYDADGDKQRVVQFRAAGIMAPSSLSFTREGPVLVTPGCYSFDPRPARP